MRHALALLWSLLRWFAGHMCARLPPLIRQTHVCPTPRTYFACRRVTRRRLRWLTRACPAPQQWLSRQTRACPAPRTRRRLRWQTRACPAPQPHAVAVVFSSLGRVPPSCVPSPWYPSCVSCACLGLMFPLVSVCRACSCLALSSPRVWNALVSYLCFSLGSSSLSKISKGQKIDTVRRPLAATYRPAICNCTLFSTKCNELLSGIFINHQPRGSTSYPTVELRLKPS